MPFQFGSHSVVIDTIDTGGPIKLGGITSMGVPLGTEYQTDDSGAIHDKSASITFQAPKPQASTKSIAAALAVIPQTGICLNTNGSHLGAFFYGEAKSDCQVGEPGSANHLSYLVGKGLLVPETLSGSLREDVQLSFSVDAISDGTNAPLAGSYGATLPTGLDLSQYAVGAIKIANILWSDTRRLNLAFNVRRGEDDPQLGGIWPIRASRVKAQPVLELTARDPSKLDDSTGIPLLGKSAIHGNTVVYFKKRLNRGAFEADASTVHLKMTMSGLVYFDNPFSASGNANAETSIRLVGLNDGTNFPIVFTFGIAYNPSP